MYIQVYVYVLGVTEHDLLDPTAAFPYPAAQNVSQNGMLRADLLKSKYVNVVDKNTMYCGVHT